MKNALANCSSPRLVPFTQAQIAFLDDVFTKVIANVLGDLLTEGRIGNMPMDPEP